MGELDGLVTRTNTKSPFARLIKVYSCIVILSHSGVAAFIVADAPTTILVQLLKTSRLQDFTPAKLLQVSSLLSSSLLILISHCIE